MPVLLIGAYGFIGCAIAHELVRRGQLVTGVGRDIEYGRRLLPKLRWVAADLARMTAAERWAPLLEGHDAVVNASGILQSGDGGSVEAVQFRATTSLIEACEAAGIKRFVQISAAGAHLEATYDFMATKARADEAIGASAVPSLVIRPGLVIGRNSFGGTELIRMAAAAPVALTLPFRRPIHCIALADVVEVVAEAIEQAVMPTGCFDLVEPEGRSLEAIIAAHRQWLGLPTPRRSVRLPHWLLKAVGGAADLFGLLGWRSPLRTNGLRALEQGVTGDPGQARVLVGREPASLEETLGEQPAGKQDRLHARLGLALPLTLAALFLMWAASGLATLLQLERAAAILADSGIGQDLAYVIAVGGALLDLILAVGLLWRRTVRPVLLTMIIITLAAYLIGGSVLLPDLWLDPLAPFAKALPATMLALVAYWLLERR